MSVSYMPIDLGHSPTRRCSTSVSRLSDGRKNIGVYFHRFRHVVGTVVKPQRDSAPGECSIILSVHSRSARLRLRQTSTVV